MHSVLIREAFELIVVSDGPDKLTANALAGFQTNHLPRLRYLITTEKRGPAAARNYGWLNAKGTLIAFTDDDCLPDADWLHHLQPVPGRKNILAFSGKTIVPVPKKPTDYELNMPACKRLIL
jgi:glycosyltransferase involved in cell wall biosynthesis